MKTENATINESINISMSKRFLALKLSTQDAINRKLNTFRN